MKVEIPDNIRIQYKLPEGIDAEIKEVNPLLLLCGNRLDIAAKIWFLENNDNIPERAKAVYLEHIRAMTKGSFVEAYSEKKSADS
ncbi:MAG: hypothetical protein K6G30_02730, partial [Acetatifactor sp.]|nr:hypothetical protein [Acetatifactor sp.]